MTRPDSHLAAWLAAAGLAVPLLFSPTSAETFAIPKLIGIGFVVAVGFVLAAMARGTLEWRMTDTLVVIFAILVLVSFLFSVDRSQSLLGEVFQRQGVAALELYAAGYFLARLGIRETTQRLMLVRGIVLGATLVAIYAVIQGLKLDPLWGYPVTGRVFSTIGQPNSLGAYLAMSLPLTVAVAARSRTRSWIFWGGSAVVQLVAVLMTASRGGVLAVVAGFAVAFLVMIAAPVRSGGRLVVVSVLAGATLVVALVWVAPVRDAGQRLADRVLAHDIGQQSQGHVDLWRVAGKITVDHPLVGTGPDTFPEVFPAYARVMLESGRAQTYARYRVESPHNIYLALSSGMGIPALAVYVVLVAMTLFACLANARRRRSLVEAGLAAAIVAYLVANFFITAELAGTWLFWLLLGHPGKGYEAPMWLHLVRCPDRISPGDSPGSGDHPGVAGDHRRPRQLPTLR